MENKVRTVRNRTSLQTYLVIIHLSSNLQRQTVRTFNSKYVAASIAVDNNAKAVHCDLMTKSLLDRS